MTEAKTLKLLFRILREELPLMTNLKLEKVAAKILKMLQAYKTITLTEEPKNGSEENTQLPKKSKDW